MEKEKIKLLIVSQDLPPAVGGSPILMDNLFAYFPGQLRGVSAYHGSQYDSNFKVSFPVTYVNPPNIPFVGNFIRKHHDRLLRYFHWYIIKKIKQEIKGNPPDAIYSNCPNIDFFICAYKVSRKHKIPLIIHMHDLWEENATSETYIGKMARKWEKTIMKHASAVLCMTEVQQQHYEKKYNIQSALIPHTIKDSDLDDLNEEYRPIKRNNILFTGAISQVMNLDAMKQFAKATHILDKNLTIDVCTGASSEYVFSLGFNTTNTHVQWLSRSEVQDLQKESGVLFAPLSFKNGGMDEVATVFSTKILEYLISGRPIVIFAPSFSHHAISAKKYGWAYVVDKDDPLVLLKEVKQLFENDALSRSIVANAYKEAQRRKSSISANKLAEIIMQSVKK